MSKKSNRGGFRGSYSSERGYSNKPLPGIAPSQYDAIYGDYEDRETGVGFYPAAVAAAVKPPPVVEHIPIRPKECLTYLQNVLTLNIPEKLIFSEKAWIKINCYVQIVGGLEITGFGKIENGVVTDVTILPNQVVRKAHANVEAEWVAAFMKKVPINELPLWTLDWHSHADIGMVKPSGTDLDNYEEINDLRDKEGFPYLIMNRAGKVHAGFFLGNGHKTTMEVEVPATLDRALFEPIYNQCKKEIAANCLEERITYPSVVVGKKGGFVPAQSGESCIVSRN
jgi:hypothetical protein